MVLPLSLEQPPDGKNIRGLTQTLVFILLDSAKRPLNDGRIIRTIQRRDRSR